MLYLILIVITLFILLNLFVRRECFISEFPRYGISYGYYAPFKPSKRLMSLNRNATVSPLDRISVTSRYPPKKCSETTCPPMFTDHMTCHKCK